ncbi:hypothetical protein CB1_002337021 [Camelus ferus]|nr:hypothetical protein CB1_002337021 [Camelus ferus]
MFGSFTLSPPKEIYTLFYTENPYCHEVQELAMQMKTLEVEQQQQTEPQGAAHFSSSVWGSGEASLPLLPRIRTSCLSKLKHKSALRKGSSPFDLAERLRSPLKTLCPSFQATSPGAPMPTLLPVAPLHSSAKEKARPLLLKQCTSYKHITMSMTPTN